MVSDLSNALSQLHRLLMKLADAEAAMDRKLGPQKRGPKGKMKGMGDVN